GRRAEQAGEHRRRHDEARLRSPRAGLGQLELHVELLADELERKPSLFLRLVDDQHVARPRPPEKRRRAGADDLPAGAARGPAPAGLHARDAGPPVGEVEGLRHERPHVVNGGEQLARCLVRRHGVVPYWMPSRFWTRRLTRLITWRSCGDASTAVTIA